MSVALLSLSAATLAVWAVTANAGSTGADAAHPTVVELFQSQGCSSCPPANANVMAITDRPDVLALSFQVTYWDQLGWKDTFASPAYTKRQYDYANGLRHDGVWTPQVVINGRRDVVGIKRGELDQALAAAQRGTGGPSVVVTPGHVSVTGSPAHRAAEVWLARYDPRVIQIAIARGENGGRTLPHRNVVRELVLLGVWRGPSGAFNLPPAKIPGLREAILVQDGTGGPILAATRA